MGMENFLRESMLRTSDTEREPMSCINVTSVEAATWFNEDENFPTVEMTGTHVDNSSRQGMFMNTNRF